MWISPLSISRGGASQDLTKNQGNVKYKTRPRQVRNTVSEVVFSKNYNVKEYRKLDSQRRNVLEIKVSHCIVPIG